MKKLILTSILMLVLNTQAQFTMSKVGSGIPILNNDIFTFSAIDTNAAELKFNINNNTASNIFIRSRCMSISNTDGSGMQFCFGGTCAVNVAVGVSFPTDEPFHAIIPAMGNNGNFDHFRNMNFVNTTSTQDYVFKFFQVDAAGTEIGTPITITYRYQPVLATTSFSSLENLGVQLQSNVIENQLNIKLSADMKLEMYDVNGRNVLTKSLNSGDNAVDVSNLMASVYFLTFIDNNGNKASAKCIKK